MDRFRNTAVAAAVLATGAIAFSACGRDNADLANGKTEFVNKCGACHVLARAGTKGTQGPSLDSAFASARQSGMNNSTIKGITLRQIAHPRRGSIMPKDLVKGDDAQDVAAYVGYAAGKPGKDEGALAQAGGAKASSKPIAAKGGKLQIDAIGGTAFASTAATAPAGELQVVMANKSPLPHNIGLKNVPNAEGEVVNQGGTSQFSVLLKSGTYTYFCAVPGHEAAGMKGTLTVK